MRKSVYLSAAAAALLLAAAALLQLPGRDASAQAGGVYINAVDLDINPADTAKFLEFVKENGAASVKEPGCREFNITVLAKDPNHVFLFEVYDNEAALNAHRATDHFKKFAAATANMVTGRNVRALSPVAFNSKGSLSAPLSPRFGEGRVGSRCTACRKALPLPEVGEGKRPRWMRSFRGALSREPGIESRGQRGSWIPGSARGRPRNDDHVVCADSISDDNAFGRFRARMSPTD